MQLQQTSIFKVEDVYVGNVQIFWSSMMCGAEYTVV